MAFPEGKETRNKFRPFSYIIHDVHFMMLSKVTHRRNKWLWLRKSSQSISRSTGKVEEEEGAREPEGEEGGKQEGSCQGQWERGL